MAKRKQNRKLRITTLLLTLLLLLSFSALVFTACSKEEETEEETTTAKTDTQTFPNADFEYFDDNSETYRIASANSWTSGTVSNGDVSASSSVAKSGIVDTSFDWSEFVTAYNEYKRYSEMDEDDPELEDAKYYTDIDNYYDIPGWDVAKAGLADGKDSNSLTDEQISAAAKAVNPGVHWANDSDAEKTTEDKGSSVLMLHNYRTDKYGTAAKYTSSSITLSAGTAASVSVWVKTAGLYYNDETAVAGDRGAFIEISPSVGGSTQDSILVRNIDTQTQNAAGDNNGWVEYTFYIKAATYSDTTFTVILGLGRQAEGITANYYEYVQGYAFFDDLTYKVMTGGEYADATADVTAAQNIALDLSFGSDDAKFNASDVTDRKFAYDLDALTADKLTLTNTAGIVQPTSEEQALETTTFATYFKNVPAAQSMINSQALDLSLSGYAALADIQSNTTYATALQDGLEKLGDLPFYDDDNILLLYSSKGLPYTAEVTNDNVGGNLFTVAKDGYMLVSFWVKTSDLNGGTGATVTLVDAKNESNVIGAVDTSTLTGVNLKDDYSDEREDIYDGWQQCSFFVSNTTDGELTFSLKFSFGPTTFSDKALTDYTPGYAAFTALRTAQVNEDEYAILSTGTYAVSASLAGDAYTSSTVFDEVAYSDEKVIETDIADLRNYKGVYGGTTHVGGETIPGDNKNAAAGLLNKKYAASYTNGEWLEVLQENFSFAGALTDSLWAQIFGNDCTQPLLIANTVEQSYGFIRPGTSSFASSSYSMLTLRVKLSAGATANIYLIDTTAPDDSKDSLGTEKQYVDSIAHETGVSYRYNKDGDVVNLDPDDDLYGSENILFHRQDNGLWTKSSKDDGEYFANLKNYEKDSDGNLLNDKGEIVYYLSDGTYYRYKDADSDKYSVAVKDFADAGIDLAGALLQDATRHELSRTITNDTNNVSGWIYVNFFISGGDESKSYRLEVWSGDRTGETKNAADSFVIFDVVNYGSLDETSFNNQVSDQLTAIAESLGYEDADALKDAYDADPAAFANGITKNSEGDTVDNAGELVYYHFSLYDDDSYNSYDADHSTSTVDPYSEYDPSAYSDKVAYLARNYVENGTQYYDTFINFAASEITVSTTTEDETTEETTDDTTPGYNVWLLTASIVLAAALIFTLLAMLGRKLFSNIRKKSVQKVKPMYSNTRDIYIRKLRQEEAEREPEEEDEDELSEEDLYNEQPLGEEMEEGSETPASDDEQKPSDDDQN